MAAWFAVRALAGTAAAGVRGLYSGAIQEVCCETGEPVDDCRVRLADGAVLALQAKRFITLGTTTGSELAKTVDQFVRQHLWAGHETDQLVLVTTSDSPSTVTKDLADALDRIREAPSGSSLTAGCNARQVRAYTTFVSHVKRAWKQHTEPAVEPSDAQLRVFLARCWVWVLDVEEGKDGEREALTLLRVAVVAGTDQADSAWDTLLRVCDQLCKKQTGIDLAGLQTKLTETKVRLATIRDFVADVARLTALTQQTLAQMDGELTAIPGPEGDVTVKRGVDDVLSVQAEQGSCLVTGEPGAGKSAALHHLAGAWHAAGRPVLFLQVSSLASLSAGQLQDELHLEYPLLEVLGQWAPGAQGLLVLDALDAARSGTAEQLWRQLIRQVRQRLPHWRVVASVRAWDLEHSASLGSLIPGDALVVGDWDDAEFAKILTAVPALAELVASSQDQVKRLLRNPFNLRLAAQLLLEGVEPADLHAVDSRLDLLGRYWKQRVSGVPDGPQRSAFLTEWCQAAVAARQLAVSAQPLLAGNTSTADVLNALLSDRVLMPAAASEIGADSGLLGPVQFSHHVLFDYALARAYFGVGNNGLAGRLSADPDALLFAHPSVDMYLELAWRQGPATFWQLALKLAEAPMPRMAAAAVAGVVVRCCRTAEALVPLLDQVIAGAPGAQHLAHALAVAVSLAVKSSTADGLGVWCELTERLSQHSVAAPGALLILVCDLASESLPAPAFAQCGRAARALLAYLWTLPVALRTRLAITAVVHTASSAPQDTADLLHRALQPGQLAERGHNDLFALTQDVPRLLQCLPELVEDLYVDVMSYDEASTEPTQMGSGVVLTLVSTQQQDYSANRYQLIQHFPAVYRADVTRALNILTRLSRAGADTVTEHTGEVAGRVIRVAGRVIRVAADDSRLWDLGSYQRRDLVALLDAFQQAVTTTEPAQLEGLLDAVAAAPQAAAVWRRLLKAATDNAALAQHLASPADALVRTFNFPDLLAPLAGLISVVHPALAPDQAGRLEDAVRVLKGTGPAQDAAWPGWAADPYQLLVDALSPAHLVHAELAADQSPAVADSGYSDLAPAAPPAAAPPPSSADRQRCQQLSAQVEQFVDTHQTTAPSDDAMATIEPAVRELFTLAGSQPEPVRHRAELLLAQAAERFTRPAQAPDGPRHLAREVLLSMQAPPQQTVAPDQHFSGLIPDDACGWAATGLLQLSRLPGWYTQEVKDAILSLAKHPEPWVRICVARSAYNLAQTDPDTAWDLLDHFADHESDPMLLNAVLKVACLQLGDPGKGMSLLSRVAARVEPDDAPGSVAASLTEITGYLWVDRAVPQAATVLTDLRARWEVRTVWASLLHTLRESGLLNHNDQAVRARALTLITELAEAALPVLQQAYATPAEQWDSAGRARIKDSARLLDDIALQLCAGSGATGHDGSPATAEQVRLVDEAAPVVDLLQNASVPGVTHHLIQMYAHAFDERPRLALLAVRDVLTAPGAPVVYASDSLALDLCVSLVERVLADHRELLRMPECLTAVRQICDVFVDAGWPRAHQLVFGIEQVFR
ncbi:ATP-binding protein [Streptomyces sp. NPDC093084]|uniref:ATP-binding protein n=1 Tax=Streptomyces sp. NPDC093084 TaxID=3155197 RepID=UPI003429C709